MSSLRWPGNIRELEATLHRAIVMSSSDSITCGDFQGLFGDNGIGAVAAPSVPVR